MYNNISDLKTFKKTFIESKVKTLAGFSLSNMRTCCSGLYDCKLNEVCGLGGCYLDKNKHGVLEIEMGNFIKLTGGITASYYEASFTSVPVRPLCPLPVTRVLPHPLCPSLPHVPGVPPQPYPCSRTQYPSWDTKPVIPHSSVPFSAFVTFIPTFFVPLTSVCMSYPKLNPQLKWKSSLYPSHLRAITSSSLRHRCHVCCSLEDLMVVLPFSPSFLT